MEVIVHNSQRTASIASYNKICVIIEELSLHHFLKWSYYIFDIVFTNPTFKVVNDDTSLNHD